MSLISLDKPGFPMKKGVGILLLAACLWPVPGAAAPALIHDKGCDGCHRFSPDSPAEAAKAPDLFYAGQKFQKPWLKRFLQHPEVIRKAGYITDPGFISGTSTVAQPHPALSKKEAAKAADYLMSLKIPDLPEGQIDNAPLSKGKRAKAKYLFERTFGCTACHETINLAGKPRGGISGPSLVDAGNRLQPDWVFNRLKTPEIFSGKSRMPRFQLDDETIVQLTKFIMTLKKERLK